MRVISGSARGTKLHSIEDINTRPTLDRVKESLFNILQQDITEDTRVLDLFAGSGAVGIEFLSRGANTVIFSDSSPQAVNMINQNLEKTHLQPKAKIYQNDFRKVLTRLEQEHQKFDIIFLDPPYKDDIAIQSLEQIQKYMLLQEDGIIIIETDEYERDAKEIKEKNLNFRIYDVRKYGRATLIFLKHQK